MEAFFGLNFTSFAVSLITKVSTFTGEEGFILFHEHVGYLIIIIEVFMNKYIFYVSILNHRIKFLVQNFDWNRASDYEVYAMPRLLSILWKLSAQINKIFGYQMVVQTLNYYFVLGFFGHLLASDMEIGIGNWIHVLSYAAPSVAFFAVSIICGQVRINVSFNLF